MFTTRMFVLIERYPKSDYTEIEFQTWNADFSHIFSSYSQHRIIKSLGEKIPSLDAKIKINTTMIHSTIRA